MGQSGVGEAQKAEKDAEDEKRAKGVESVAGLASEVRGSGDKSGEKANKNEASEPEDDLSDDSWENVGLESEGPKNEQNKEKEENEANKTGLDVLAGTELKAPETEAPEGAAQEEHAEKKVHRKRRPSHHGREGLSQLAGLKEAAQEGADNAAERVKASAVGTLAGLGTEETIEL